MTFPSHDELHVISDLHMGGARVDFQILRETRRLTAYIRWVAAQRPTERVALVLNGDIFDTLAEDVGGYIAVDTAADTVQRIVDRDPSFAPVWDALAAFTRTPNRTLVLVIGNHDIEIAFPPVQRLIVARLAGEDPAARGRIEFATAGAGFACLVGGARIFCTHGNEVDAWNYVRYEDLARVARRVNAGRALAASEWEPNAGTKMVKDVMNEVKRRYAWIDLLKPETKAAVGVLLVLDPAQAGKLGSLFPIVGERVRGGGEFAGRLGADGFAPPAAAGAARPGADLMLGPRLREALVPAPATRETADQMLQTAEKSYRERAPGAAVPAQTLGTPQLVWDRLTGWLTGVSKPEALRRALLDWLKDDDTFKIETRDETFTGVTDSVGPGVDFIVTGHTHLARAIERGPGRFYFNCGTWIRLLQLTPEMLASEAAFAPVYEVLADGHLAAIDAASFGGKPFVLDWTTAVRISAEPAGVVGELIQVQGGPETITPTPVGRRLVRSS